MLSTDRTVMSRLFWSILMKLPTLASLHTTVTVEWTTSYIVLHTRPVAPSGMPYIFGSASAADTAAPVWPGTMAPPADGGAAGTYMLNPGRTSSRMTCLIRDRAMPGTSGLVFGSSFFDWSFG